MSAPLQKIVNGQPVDMDPAEEAATRAAWSKAPAAPPAAPPDNSSLAQRVAALEAIARAKGWAV